MAGRDVTRSIKTYLPSTFHDPIAQGFRAAWFFMGPLRPVKYDSETKGGCVTYIIGNTRLGTTSVFSI